MAAPFTTADVRQILNDVLKVPAKPPNKEALRRLVASLNRIRGVFNFATQTGKKSRVTADQVSDALAVLTAFFEERERQYGSVSTEIVESEQWLSRRFQTFVRAMEAHEFRLDMDAGLLMPEIKNWRHIAVAVAAAFKAAMHPQKMGLSNDGPVARFVARVHAVDDGRKPVCSKCG